MSHPQHSTPTGKPHHKNKAVKFNVKLLQLSARQPNKFLDLPTEIHIAIHSLLDDPPSQACLGLTCKTMARVLEIVHIAWFPKMNVMQGLVGWMPADYRLCIGCLKYKPQEMVREKVVATFHPSRLNVCKGCWDWIDDGVFKMEPVTEEKRFNAATYRRRRGL